MSDYKINTKCVQAGYTPGNGEPRQIPIIQSTTFKYATSEDMGKLFDLEANGYFYTRLQNPTNDSVAATKDSNNEAQTEIQEVPEEIEVSVPELTQTPSNNNETIVSDIEQKALDVIRGKYGNGDERKEKLGSDYTAVQKKVNELYKQGIR